MNLIEFSSRLTENDMKIFLTKYAGFQDCEISAFVEGKISNEMFCHFQYNGCQYLLKCSDFFMRINSDDNDKEYCFKGIATDDDWFCFLKSKFGMDFVKQYNEMFNAEAIIKEDSKYISQISYDELIMILKRLVTENPLNVIPFKMDDDVQFIEVESFFKSERRFLVRHKNTNLHFFIRISDFQVIVPRVNNGLFARFMVGKFGADYINEYKKHIHSLYS